MTAQGVTLTWFGHACFRVTDTAGHTVVLDPYHPQVMGQALRGLTADLLLITHEHQDHNYLDAVHARRVIHGLTEARDGAVVTLTDAPSGIAVTLVPTFHDTAAGAARGRNISVVWQQGGLTLCHTGDLGGLPDPATLAAFGHPDVLFLPVGGHFTLDVHAARTLVAQLAPRVVIPMHFKVPGMTNEHIPIGDVEAFLDDGGPWHAVRRPDAASLTLAPDTLPAATEVVVLTPARV